MRLIATLAALLIAAHRDERGQLNFFKDLWKKASDGVGKVADVGGAIKDLVAWFGQLAVNAISAAGGRLVGVLGAMLGMAVNAIIAIGLALRDLLTWFGTIATNTLRDVGAAVRDLLTWFGTQFVNLVRDAAGAMKDLATWFGTQFVNVVTGAAGQLSDLTTWYMQLWLNLFAGLGERWIDMWKWFGTLLVNTAKESADRVGDAADATKDAITAFPDELKDKLTALFEGAFGFGPELLDNFIDLAERFMAGEITTIDQLVSSVKEKKPESTWQERTLYAMVFIPAIVQAFMQMAGVAGEPMVQRFRADHPSALLDPEDLRDAYLRGFTTFEEVYDQLSRAGYRPEHVRVLVDLWDELPPPSDLIRMAVREAFSPGIVARFGQHEDFPTMFKDVVKQQGYSEDWALAYWAAHWELPSAEQGFDMFHRGVIDFETLQLLLRALDVMPFWRGKLTDIAYNTVTRVDTRRLFSAGVWDRARVELEYLRQGYRPEDAAAITAWTVQEYGDTGVGARDLTRAAIEQAFRQGRIGRGEALASLVDLGYDEDEADFLLSNAETQLADAQASAAEAKIRDVTQSTILRAYGERIVPRGEAESMLADLGYTAEGVELLLSVEDFNTQHDLAALRAKVIEQQFRQGTITAGEARAQLASAGYGVERADLVVQRWEIQYGAKDRDLTEAQLRNALQGGLIDSAAYVRRVGALGYAGEDAKILLALAGGADTEDVRQLSRAQIIDAYKRTIIPRATAAQRLADLGFAGDDVQLQLAIADQDLARAEQQRQQRETDAAAAAVKDLARTSIEGAYKRGIITRDGAGARLVALGFRPGDAELLLQVVDADLGRPTP